MTVTSSSLLKRLENVNWCYSISTVLQGVSTNLLVKYVVEENAYAIMLTDFSSAYFECLIGDQIEQHHSRFNNKTKRFTYSQILEHLADLLHDLRASNSLSFEKIEVDCHTSRITIKTTKTFRTLKLNWNFYIISTEPDIFMKHFSLPMWRGLVHFYQLAKGQNSHANSANDSSLVGHQHSLDGGETNNSQDSTDLLPPIPDDSLLKELFR